MEGPSSSISDLPAAIRVVQQKAKDDLVLSLQNFDDVFKNVSPTYLSGNFTGEGTFSPQISPLIGKSAQIICCARNYKNTLSITHSWGFSIPAPELFPKIKAFTYCLKHCTNPEKWDFFSTFIRLLREFDSFIKDDRSSPMRDGNYNSGLDEHINGLTRLVYEDICSAVITREEDIEQHRAHPIPMPQYKEYETTTADPATSPLDYLVQTAGEIKSLALNINKNTTPANPDREFIYDLVARIRSDKEINLGKHRSYQSATNYIRWTKEPAQKYAADITAARNFAISDAKTCKDGEDKFWNSIAGDSRPSQRKRRAKSRNAPPGETPILYKGCG